MKTKIKNLIMISFLFLPLYNCQKEIDFSDCETHSGNGKIDRILEYEAIDSEVPKRILEQYKYDESGRIAMVSVPMAIDTNIDNRLYYYDLYEYNAENRLSKIFRFNANIYSPTGFNNQSIYHYTYSNEGKVIKEYIEYPLINSYSYSLYYYTKDKLKKIEEYKMGTDELESYIEYEYDNCGRLIKENTVSMCDITFIYFTEHQYQKGLNDKSDIYAGRSASNIEHIRVMTKTYDENYNLIINEINELDEYSTQASRVIRYEYLDE